MKDMAVRMMAIVAVVGLCVGLTGVSAAERDSAEVTLRAGTVTGRVADSLGNAVGDMDVELEGADEDVVASTATRDGGRFEMELAEGEYTLSVGDDLEMPVKVRDDRGVRELALVIPGKDVYSAGQEEGGGMFGWATESGGPLGLSTAGLVAGGAVLAGGTTAAVVASDSGGSSDDDPVSP